MKYISLQCIKFITVAFAEILECYIHVISTTPLEVEVLTGFL